MKPPVKSILSALAMCALLLTSARGENVRWSSDQFPITSLSDLSRLSPVDPTFSKLCAFRDAGGNIAIMAPSGAPSKEAILLGETRLGENHELRIPLNAFHSDADTGGWYAIFVGVKNAKGFRAGVIFNASGYFPAKWTPGFLPLDQAKPYALPSDIRIRRQGGQLIISLGGKTILTMDQPQDAPLEVPIVTASRQKTDAGVLGIFAPAVIDVADVRSR